MTRKRALPLSLLHALAFAAVVAAAPRARASDAEDLFREAVRLLEAGNVHAACDKLAQSQALEPAAGTLLNLADCYERDGKQALALSTFMRARAAARTRNRTDWVKTSGERIAALEARVPKLEIVAPNVPGLRILLDGTDVGEDALRDGARVDVGTHVLEATAPGRVPHLGTIDVRASMKVRIPELVLAAARTEAPPPKGPAAASGGSSPLRTVGYVTLGVGVAALVTGGVSALVAKGALADAKVACESYPTRCSPESTAPNDRAKTWSTVATFATVSGAVLGAAGVVMIVWPRSRATVSASAAPGGGAAYLTAPF